MSKYELELIEELTEALACLVNKYVANKDTEHEFISCITPNGVPWYWVRAKQAVKAGRDRLEKKD